MALTTARTTPEAGGLGAERAAGGRAGLDGVPTLIGASRAGGDLFAEPEALIRRVYAYVSYRLGHGPEAEDVVATTFERAIRYRHSYTPKRGEPIAWLIGIAKHAMNDALSARARIGEAPAEVEASTSFEDASIERLALRQAIARLSERDQELLALRYGADLSTRAIAKLVNARPNAVDVALHRALARLRTELAPAPLPAAGAAPAPEGRA
ncbi:MAG TPA: sigma-70 family RNA polymerase sigma factor [Gaiellaceae bacterium]|nr:sigma-70 family RNA polymerase sigma factor [Gaiellaceae bacterium]